MATELIDPEFFAMLAVYSVLFIILGIFVLISYVYYSYAQMILAKKLGHSHPWVSWIPIARDAQFLQLGNFNWTWIFLLLIPIFGWIALYVMEIIAYWRICEKRNYPGWFSLVKIAWILPGIGQVASIANLVIFGIITWQDKKPSK